MAAPAPSPEELGRFDLNDFGNGLRLILLTGGMISADYDVDVTQSVLLYLHGSGWIGFNGRHWDRKHGDDMARRFAHKVALKVRSPEHRAAKAGVPEKDYFKWADGVGSSGSTTAMLKQAQSYLTVELDAFDTDPMAINCRNGTVKIRPKAEPGSGGAWGVELLKHDPADRITRMAAVDWLEADDPKAARPLFDKVLLDSLPEAEDRAYMNRICGYGVSGDTREQAFFLIQGLGRDGKSTILDACREAAGGYGGVGSPLTFLEGGPQSGSAAAPDLVKLAGDCRFVVVSEPKKGARLNEGLIKAWTSGSPITARTLNEKPFEFRPIGKLVWECNVLPDIRGDDDGIWRRNYLLMFEKQVPKHKVDKTLGHKIQRGELPGVLRWMVEGLLDWLARDGLCPPERWLRALEEYRRTSAPFGDWLNSRCIWGAKARDAFDESKAAECSATELHQDFEQWSIDQGTPKEKVMSQHMFGRALTDRQVLVVRKDGKGRKWRGPIRLKTPQELEAEAAVLDAGPEASPGSGGAGVADPGAVEREPGEEG